MKSLIVLALLGLGSNAFACGDGLFRGDVKKIRALTGVPLNCNYNGEESKGRLSISIPKCPGALPLVTITAFEGTYSVTSVSARKDGSFHFFTDQTDWSFACRVPEL